MVLMILAKRSASSASTLASSSLLPITSTPELSSVSATAGVRIAAAMSVDNCLSTAGGVRDGAITMVVGAKSKPGIATLGDGGDVGRLREARLFEFCASNLTRLS